MSLYFAVLQHPVNSEYELARHLGSFEPYLRWRAQVKPISQSSYMTEPSSGEQLLNYVGRFETLAEDVDRIADRIGLRLALPRLNRAVHRESVDYRRYYTPESQRLVGEVWGEDIDRFGYSF